MKRVIVAIILPLVLLFALGMIAYGETNKVKLTGAEIQLLVYESNVVIFGLSPKVNTVWLTVGHENGGRDMYWRSLVKPGLWRTNTGTARIDGDKSCLKWSNRPTREICYDVYRVGENKYESWLEGSLESTWFRGQTEYNEPKKKEKQTAAYFTGSGVFAGISHNNNSIWLIWTDGDKRDLYWRSLAIPGFSGSDTTTARIDGDKECLKWTWGPEKCVDHYRVGEDIYETRLNGNIDSTYFRLK